MSVEAMSLIARIRRQMPQNGQVLELCEGYERLLIKGGVATSVPTVEAEAVGPTGFVCERCERERVRKADEMKRYRAKRKGK